MTVKIRTLEFAGSVEFDTYGATAKTITGLGVMRWHAHPAHRAVKLAVLLVLEDLDHPFLNVMVDVSIKLFARDPLGNLMFEGEILSHDPKRGSGDEPFGTTFAFYTVVPAGVDGRYSFTAEIYVAGVQVDATHRALWVVDTEHYDPPSPLNLSIA